VSTLQQQLLDAVAAHRSGDLAKAEAAYRAILRAQPKHFDATHLLGAALSASGRNKEAEIFLKRAVALNPKVAAAQNNLGNAVKALHGNAESLPYYERAIGLDPNYADAINNRGNVQLEIGNSLEALADYDRALAINPNFVNALQKSAKVLVELGRYEEALIRNDRALALEANSVDAWVRSGNVLTHLKRHENALKSYERALVLDPGNTDALINRSAALEALGRPEEAFSGLDRVLAAVPDAAGALNNKATILKSLGRLDEACDHFSKALAIKPDDADARTNYAMTLLLRGDFEAGWREYEGRWAKKSNVQKRPALTCPVWAGEPLEDRRIVVFAEQGLGDIVQFSRYLPLLKEHGANVTFLVTDRMLAVLRAAYPGIAVTADVKETVARAFDFQCPMMSLPLRFGTRLETIPASVPYLKADCTRVAQWRERVGQSGFKVGICWQGNPDASVDSGRSVLLEAFAPLASIPGVRLISLQKNAGVEQIERNPFPVETLGADFDNTRNAFVDTLAVMENLNLIVSPDTSIAHVAGALGRPAWVVLKRVPDWRWLMKREDCPWYPSLRLFRQEKAGQWDGVFARLRDHLATLSNTAA
jgi:tetratricopeptide (TPR) repeat protein